MIPQDLTYHSPEGALVFFVAIFFPWLFWYLASWRKDVLKGFGTESVLDKVVLRRSTKIFWLKALAFLFAWIFAVFALMQPEGNAHYPEEGLDSSKKGGESLGKIRRKTQEVIFLIDASASMAVPDSRTRASRLDFAKEIIDQIISQLNGESGALYAFTSEPTQLSPLTYDYLFLRLMARQIKINEGDVPGTSLTNALQEIRNKYFNTGDTRLKTLILLTDGGDTTIESLEGPQKEQAIENLLKLFDNAEKNHLRVYTVGMGSLEGQNIPNLIYEGKQVHSGLNEDLLRKIARRGRGIYYPARDYTSIELAKELIGNFSKDSPFYEEEALVRSLSSTQGDNRIYDRYFQIPLFLSLVLLGWILLWPEARKNALKLIPFLLLPFSLGAETPLENAAAYFQAEDYSHASQIYEDLLDKKNPLWEREVLTYNLGTTLLAEGEYEKAVALFNEIPLEDDPQPLLEQRVRVNRTLAFLGQARRLEQDGQLDQLEKSLYAYRYALKEIALAFKAHCRLEEAEGAKECKPSKNLNNIKTSAKESYAALIKKLLTWRITHSSWLDGISLIAISMNQLIREVTLVQSKPMGEDLRRQYGSLIAREGENWKNIWDAVREKLSSQSDKSYAKEFDQSYDQFTLGLRSIYNNDFDKGRELWVNSQATLKNLLTKIFKGEPQEELLRKLLASYNFVYVHSPLQESTIAALEAEQEELVPLFSGQIQPTINQARQSLEKSFTALQNSNPSLAQFHLAYARHLISHLLLTTVTKSQEGPEVILNRAIESQHDALDLNRLFKSTQMNDKERVSLFATVLSLQKDVIDAASPFLSTVFDLQEKEFSKGICQASPWGEVLPLFAEGWQLASNAADEKESIPIEIQEKALEKWRQAVEKLHHPSTSFSCKGKKEERREEKKNQQPDKQKDKNEPQKEEPKSSMNEVLRQLIEMDQDDRLPKSSSVLQIKGVKPW